MIKAKWKGIVLAECDRIIKHNGKPYFPHTAIKNQFFVESEKHSVCPEKGVANYYHIEVNGHKKLNAAYYFPNPNPRVKPLQNYIGFDDSFEISDE